MRVRQQFLSLNDVRLLSTFSYDDWREQLWAHNVAYFEVVDMLQFGSEDVKGHKWFRTIVWDEVYHKKLKVG